MRPVMRNRKACVDHEDDDEDDDVHDARISLTHNNKAMCLIADCSYASCAN